MYVMKRGDATVIQTSKWLVEHGGKVSPEAGGMIESALSALETAIKGDDKEPIDRALKELDKVTMELGKAVYEAEAAKAGGGGAASTAEPKPSGGGNAGDVIDAEFEVKDEKKQ